MKKYIISVKANNEKKDKILSELKSLLYKLEKGKYTGELDSSSVLKIVESLKSDTNDFENAIGTGKENINKLYEVTLNQIKELKSQAEQNYLNRFESAADELSYILSNWRAVLDGDVDSYDNDEADKKAKLSYTRKKLDMRLEELKCIKLEFSANAKRLEKEIGQLEKDSSELDKIMLNEDNERKINELYRKISATKSKIDMLNVRRSNYSGCFNTLDIVAANAEEIIVASDYSGEELGKAKALLNIDKLKNMIAEPEKAISILKRMELDIKAISDKTIVMDTKVLCLNTETAVVSEDALKYKEELMKKKRMKEQVATDTKDLEATVKPIEEDKEVIAVTSMEEI
jgi:hypothetical protein